jgi:SET domain-containing protein
MIELRGPLPGRGYGAFVKHGARIVKGQWVGEYIGELRPLSAVAAGIAAGVQSMYRFDFSNDGETVVVDSERRGNWTRFVNSSCVPNLDVA